MKFNIYTFFSSIILILLSGCYDDFVPYSEVGEGMAEISAEVTFEPLTGIINNTRSEGNIIKNIETLSVIIYTPNDELVKIYNLKPAS